jgi:hypothetical protein
MKGIREAAIPQEENKLPRSEWQKQSLFDDDRYDEAYYGQEFNRKYDSTYNKSYDNKSINNINIKIEISLKDIGESADINSNKWDEIKAETKAIEII